MAEGGSLLDLVTGGSRQVGNYFNILSGLTSVVVVGFPALLIAAGAPTHRPDFATLVKHLQGGFHIGEVAFFGVMVLVAGITVHPFQFAMTQLLEGYWGHGSLQRRAMSRSQRLETARWYALEELGGTAGPQVEAIDKDLHQITSLFSDDTLGTSVIKRLRAGQRRLVYRRIEPGVVWQQTGKAATRYPTHPELIMPTRLGNTLRRYEWLAGKPFNLDAVAVVPYLLQVAEDAEREYVEDARSAMDLPLRMVLVWALCTLEGILLLWRYDYWLGVPLFTYILAYASYRGAVTAASGYGTALQVVMALGRRNLYESLSMEFPPNLESERRQNEDLGRLLAGEEEPELDFTASTSFKERRAARVSLVGRVLGHLRNMPYWVTEAFALLAKRGGGKT